MWAEAYARGTIIIGNFHEVTHGPLPLAPDPNPHKGGVHAPPKKGKSVAPKPKPLPMLCGALVHWTKRDPLEDMEEERVRLSREEHGWVAGGRFWEQARTLMDTRMRGALGQEPAEGDVVPDRIFRPASEWG